MALIFCDGFDHYGTGDILKKWTTVYGGSIDNNIKRNGNGALKLSGLDRHSAKEFNHSNQLLVVGFACYIGNSAGDGNIFFEFRNNEKNHVTVYFSAEDNFVRISRDATTLVTYNFGFLPRQQWVFIEMKVYIHDSEGYVIIKKNDEIFYNLTGIDTRNASDLDITTLKIRSYGINYVDDIYVDNEDFLGDIKVETIYPSGAGTTTQLTPSAGDNYECVDETPLNSDTDYVSTSTANEIDTYTFSNLVTTAGTVYGVQVNMIARKDDAGSRSIAPVVRPASTDRIGSTVSISDSYMDYTQMYTTNPEDSVAWEIADVNGAEFGVKLIE